MKKIILLIAIVLTTSLSFAQIANTFWRNDNVHTITGTITDNIRPFGLIKSDDGKIYKIHLGPFWYWDQNNYSLALTNATIKGNLIENDLFPQTITQNGKTMTFTDDNGIPKWSQTGQNGLNNQYRNGCGSCNCWRNR